MEGLKENLAFPQRTCPRCCIRLHLPGLSHVATLNCRGGRTHGLYSGQPKVRAAVHQEEGENRELAISVTVTNWRLTLTCPNALVFCALPFPPACPPPCGGTSVESGLEKGRERETHRGGATTEGWAPPRFLPCCFPLGWQQTLRPRAGTHGCCFLLGRQLVTQLQTVPYCPHGQSGRLLGPHCGSRWRVEANSSWQGQAAQPTPTPARTGAGLAWAPPSFGPTLNTFLCWPPSGPPCLYFSRPPLPSPLLRHLLLFPRVYLPSPLPPPPFHSFLLPAFPSFQPFSLPGPPLSGGPPAAGAGLGQSTFRSGLDGRSQWPRAFPEAFCPLGSCTPEPCGHR